MEVQALTEVRREIDEIDPEIRELLMRRLDCSRKVAHAKLQSGDITIYRADREREILERLGAGVPDDRRDGYLAVVRKIMETSRMYQYGILYDHLEGIFEKISEGIEIPKDVDRVKILLTRPNRPNAMSSILSMIGDYGYNMEQMLLTEDDKERGTVTFELTILGDLNTEHMKKLMFQLSMESEGFHILEVQ